MENLAETNTFKAKPTQTTTSRGHAHSKPECLTQPHSHRWHVEDHKSTPKTCAQTNGDSLPPTIAEEKLQQLWEEQTRDTPAEVKMRALHMTMRQMMPSPGESMLFLKWEEKKLHDGASKEGKRHLLMPPSLARSRPGQSFRRSSSPVKPQREKGACRSAIPEST